MTTIRSSITCAVTGVCQEFPVSRLHAIEVGQLGKRTRSWPRSLARPTNFPPPSTGPPALARGAGFATAVLLEASSPVTEYRSDTSKGKWLYRPICMNFLDIVYFSDTRGPPRGLSSGERFPGLRTGHVEAKHPARDGTSSTQPRRTETGAGRRISLHPERPGPCALFSLLVPILFRATRGFAPSTTAGLRRGRFTLDHAVE